MAETTKFWLPNGEPGPQFNTPDTYQLGSAWLESEGPELLTSLGERVFGVAQRPTEKPTTIISVDLCEVVRDTGLSLLEIRGGTMNDMVSDSNTGYFDYGISFNGWPEDEALHYKQAYAQQFMHHDLVRPVKHHESILQFMKQWSESGAYVIANTSTLSGCEISTIRFLRKHYPDCFDGVLFPRNHDGNGKTTKAMATASLLTAMQDETGFDLTDIPIIAIDDVSHHAVSYSEANIETFMPAYPWNENVENQPLTTRIDNSLGPVGTFVAVDQHLNALQ